MSKIGIDLDDTVWNFYEPFILSHNQKYGTNFLPDDFKEYNFSNFLGIDRQTTLQKFSEFEEKRGHKLLFYPDFLKNFPRLAENNQIYFITARNKKYEKAIVERLEKLDSDYSLYFSRSEDNCWEPTKVQICKDKRIDYMVEDSIRNAEKISREGIEVFLLERPWTKTYENSNINKVKDWNKILEKIIK